MTMSSDSRPEGSAGALAPVPDLPDIDTSIPAEADGSAKPTGFRARLLDYSAHAAMIVGLIGFAWTVGDHVIHRPALPDAPPAKVASAPAVDPLAELRERNRALGATVQALQSRLVALQASVDEHAAVSAQVHGLQAGLDGLKTGLNTARSEQAAAVARLDGKIDKIAHEPGSKIQQLVDRLGRLERSSVDVAPTATLPHQGDAEQRSADARSAAPAVRPLPRPGDLKIDGRTEARADHKTVEPKAPEGGSTEPRSNADGDQGKPPVLASWVVRDVYRGVALIEGRRGTLEVVPGVSIPGAGIVKSIDRRGGGWTVTTTKGLMMAAAVPVRDGRRAERGYYGYNAPGYGYDF